MNGTEAEALARRAMSGTTPALGVSIVGTPPSAVGAGPGAVTVAAHEAK